MLLAKKLRTKIVSNSTFQNKQEHCTQSLCSKNRALCSCTIRAEKSFNGAVFISMHTFTVFKNGIGVMGHMLLSACGTGFVASRCFFYSSCSKIHVFDGLTLRWQETIVNCDVKLPQRIRILWRLHLQPQLDIYKASRVFTCCFNVGLKGLWI